MKRKYFTPVHQSGHDRSLAAVSISSQNKLKLLVSFTSHLGVEALVNVKEIFWSCYIDQFKCFSSKLYTEVYATDKVVVCVLLFISNQITIFFFMSHKKSVAFILHCLNSHCLTAHRYNII